MTHQPLEEVTPIVADMRYPSVIFGWCLREQIGAEREQMENVPVYVLRCNQLATGQSNPFTVNRILTGNDFWGTTRPHK